MCVTGCGGIVDDVEPTQHRRHPVITAAATLAALLVMAISVPAAKTVPRSVVRTN
ncbi:hypothetical protein GCM10023094_22420 [Rhodococcus olei]|uniref:Uncharacterized protein n=1 Tax=Rhodococcus olei TaxID=2161675 RepID=A0ABP8NZB6_9NOCA